MCSPINVADAVQLGNIDQQVGADQMWLPARHPPGKIGASQTLR
jgi:hypothetical protein